MVMLLVTAFVEVAQAFRCVSISGRMMRTGKTPAISPLARIQPCRASFPQGERGTLPNVFRSSQRPRRVSLHQANEEQADGAYRASLKEFDDAVAINDFLLVEDLIQVLAISRSRSAPGGTRRGLGSGISCGADLDLGEQSKAIEIGPALCRLVQVTSSLHSLAPHPAPLHLWIPAASVQPGLRPVVLQTWSVQPPWALTLIFRRRA